jgi:hypothetical protein
MFQVTQQLANGLIRLDLMTPSADMSATMAPESAVELAKRLLEEADSMMKLRRPPLNGQGFAVITPSGVQLRDNLEEAKRAAKFYGDPGIVCAVVPIDYKEIER